MAAELITPTDPLFGIPLFIRPSYALPTDKPHIANRHHVWHPSTAPELNPKTLAGAALRRSRIQLVLAVQHNTRDPQNRLNYHDIYAGPPLPQTEDEIFKILVAECAGFIPEEAIDLRRGEPTTSRLTEPEIAILRAPSKAQPFNKRRAAKLKEEAEKAYGLQINPGVSKEVFADRFVEDYAKQKVAAAGHNLRHVSFGYNEVKNFFIEYVKTRDLSHVSELTIEEFLLTRNTERRRFLGHWLVAQAVEVATDQANDPYRQIYRQGNLHPRMPKSVRTLVKYRLGDAQQRESLAEQIGFKLGKELGLAA